MRRRILSVLGVFSLAALLIAGAAPSALAQASQAPGLTEPLNDSTYTLGPGDRVRVIVFNEPDLSGDFDIDGRGQISVPLIGEVQAGGRNVRQVERLVESKLRDGFLRDPKVSAQVIGYRPFFILGEVRAPGSYPFVNGMTVVTAVAIAGGYTPRASRSALVIIRGTDAERRELRVSEDTAVMPGDTVRVLERFF